MSWSNFSHYEMVVTKANGKTERTRVNTPEELGAKVNRARTRADVVDVDVNTVKKTKKRR